MERYEIFRIIHSAVLMIQVYPLKIHPNTDLLQQPLIKN